MLTAALFLALVACTPPVENTDSDTDSDTDVAVEPTDFGFVYIAAEPELGFSDAGAVFRRDLRFAYDCSEVEVAGCSVLTCGDTPLDYAVVDAGTVEISGATEAISMSFDATDGYAGPFSEENLFAGGESLTAAAPGVDAPAFDLTVVAPTAVTVSEPAWPAGQGRLSVPRDAAFAFAWTGQSAGLVVANFSTDDQSVSVSCGFPAADGSASIPAAALAELPAGGGFLDIEGRSELMEQTGTWQIRFAASTHALAGGGAAIAQVNLE